MQSKKSAVVGNWQSILKNILPTFGFAPASASNTAAAELDDDDDEARSAAGSGFLGGFWDFFGIPENLGFFGIFWDFARFFKYSDIFYVSPRRFWILLLLRALVTHTYNTYKRLFRHGDIYKCFFCFRVTASDPRVSPQNHPKMTPIFWDDPNFFGIQLK